MIPFDNRCDKQALLSVNISFFLRRKIIHNRRKAVDIWSKASNASNINRSNRGEIHGPGKGYVLIQQFGRKKWRRSVDASKQRERQITINFAGLQITINFARKVRDGVSEMTEAN